MKSVAIIEGIITRVTKPVEISNHKVANLTVATQIKDKTYFHDVILWDDLALEYKKSSKVRLVGELQYKFKNGSKFSEIIAKKIEVVNE